MNIPDRLTKITSQQFITALVSSWSNGNPTKQTLCVLAAQSALETGWWKYCHNYNLGNVKAEPGGVYDYSFFACDEDLPVALAEKMVASSTLQAPCKITSVSQTKNVAVIWFYPDHPGCCFRAFCVKKGDGSIDEAASLNLGMVFHLNELYKRFQNSWPAVLTGDPRKFVQALKSQGYFTAPEKPYEDSVAAIFESLMRNTSI